MISGRCESVAALDLDVVDVPAFGATDRGVGGHVEAEADVAQTRIRCQVDHRLQVGLWVTTPSRLRCRRVAGAERTVVGVSQQASGIYQQAGELANGISSAWNGVPGAASQASVQGAPSVTTPATNLLGIPVAPLPSNPAAPTAQSSEEAVRVRLGE